MYSLPPPYSPQAPWDNLGGSGDIAAEHREPTAAALSAKGTSDGAAESMGAGESLAPVGALGLIGDGVGADL